MKHAFTLLEVMIAIAILATAMSAVFSAEAGAVRLGFRARKLDMGTLLARCKMGEIEEQLGKEGFPAISEEGNDNCCDDAPLAGFECQWKVSRVELPNALDNSADNPAGTLDQGAAPNKDNTGSAGSPLDSLMSGQALSGGGAGLGGGGGLTGMAMQYVFPILKPTIEDQVRRIDITVSWPEGRQRKSFDVTQFVVSSTPTLTGLFPPASTPSSGSGTPSPSVLPGSQK